MVLLSVFLGNISATVLVKTEMKVKLRHRKIESTLIRSSPQRCSTKKGVLGNFTKLIGKHLCQSLFLKGFLVFSGGYKTGTLARNGLKKSNSH